MKAKCLKIQKSKIDLQLHHSRSNQRKIQHGPSQLPK